MAVKRRISLSGQAIGLLLGLALSCVASAGFLSQVTGAVTSTGPVKVVVHLQPGLDPSAVLPALGGMIEDEIAGADTYLVSLPVVPAILPPGVEYLEPVTSVSLPLSPDGLVFSATGDLAADWYARQAALQVVEAPEARHHSTGLGVVVAIIDSRFDQTHPALQGRFVPGHDYVDGTGSSELNQSSTSFMFEDDDADLLQSSTSFMFEGPDLLQSSTSFMFEDAELLQSSTSFMFEALDQSSTSFMFGPGPGYAHGTFTAGVVAAVAPQAQLMPLRVFSDAGAADSFNLAKAIHHAIDQGADVINMSWGTAEDLMVLKDAVNRASAAGIILVASAGNSNSDTTWYPAGYAAVMAIAATDNLDHKAGFSSYGSHVHVSAPGKDIISTMPDGLFGIKSGTSFAGPIVAGQAALLRSAGIEQACQVISEHVAEIFADGYEGQLGSGRVKLLDSLAN